MIPLVRSLGLGLLLAGVALAGWQPIDSITNRSTSDITCQSNARSVACDSAGNIHVVWRGRIGGVWQLWCLHLNAGDTLWATGETLTSTAGGICDPSCIVGSNGSFYVCWNDSASGTLHLLMRDTLGLWVELDSIGGQPGDSMVSVCTDDSGTIHAVWRRNYLSGSVVCYASLHDAGWSRPETLTAPGVYGSWPSIACSPGDTAMAVWVGSSGQSIVSRRRAAGSWQVPETVYVGAAASPCVTWSADSFYVGWLSGMKPNQHVLIRVRSASGWADTSKLNGWRVEQPGVSVAADKDGALDVVWLGLDSVNWNYPAVQYRHRPAGDTWYAQEFLDTEFGDRLRASVSASLGRVQVAWSYSPTPGGGTYSVRLRRYEQLHDVGAAQIVQPADTVDSGAVVQPVVEVRNYGDLPENGIPVSFSFGSYLSEKLVQELAPGEAGSVVFDTCAVVMRGWNVATGSTGLAGDANPGNDAVTDSFFVRVRDVSADSIVAPADTILDTLLTPRVRIRNRGNTTADVVLHAWIAGTTYCDSLTARLGAGDDSVVNLGSWRTELDTNLFRCSVACPFDVHAENDTLSRRFRVVVSDVGVTGIVTPTDTVDSGQFVTPVAAVRNLGVVPATFDVLLRIGSLYSDTVRANALEPESSMVVSFEEWRPRERGMLSVRCSTMLAGDRDPNNDIMCCSVFVRVESLVSGQWQELKPVPFGPWRRPVKDGGCLVAVEGGLLALKGSNTREFYRYEAAVDSWMTLAGMPLGDSGRRVRAGAALCWDGNNAVYALKGNSTREFWRYDIAADSWCGLTDIPEHTTPVRHSSGLVLLPATGSDQLLSVKGGNCREFLAYRVGQGDWHSRRSLPAGSDTTLASYGTCTAMLGEHVFCLKGGTCEFYEYFPSGDSWRERARLPRLGRGDRRRRLGRGAALVSDGSRFLYAFKGGSSNEFWRYDAGADSWTQLDDIPAGTRRRKVGRGGALAWYDGRAYALKGNGSCQFWSFDPSATPLTYLQPGRDGVVEPAIALSPANRCAPGLVRCGHPVAYPVPEGAKTVLVVDAAGRVVSRGAATRLFTDLCFNRPGVYFVVMAGDSGLSTTKSMVVR